MQRRIRSTIAVLVAIALYASATSCWAGFDEGLQAYERGDYATALREFRPLADQGNADAQVNLGAMYDTGRGVPQDYALAVQWYRKAAAQGHASAQYILGMMYNSGQGVPQDYAQAAQWYRKAAEQGLADAQDNLGGLYTNGWGVPQDYAQAVEWFRKAAAQGYANAQYNLGLMYDTGRGVPQDYLQAYVWFNLAATRFPAGANRERAVQNRDRVAARLTPAQLADAQARVARWRPQPQPQPPSNYQVKPRYPESARRRGIEGTALLKVRITEQGRVEDVQVERSAGHPDLDESAMEAVRRWRFDPARRAGEPVAVWVLIPVEFTLQGTSPALPDPPGPLPLQQQETVTHSPPSQELPPERIPLKSQGGVYTVPVEINGRLTLDFVLDSGASEVNISLDVVGTLVRMGAVNISSDFLPGQMYTLADGTSIPSARLTIRSLKIGQHLIQNVPASIGGVRSQLLLGQSFLGRLGSWSIDNQQKVLVLGPSAVPEAPSKRLGAKALHKK